MSFMFPLDKFKRNHCLPLSVFLFPCSFFQPMNITHIAAIDSCISVIRHVATYESVKMGLTRPSAIYLPLFFYRLQLGSPVIGIYPAWDRTNILTLVEQQEKLNLLLYISAK